RHGVPRASRPGVAHVRPPCNDDTLLFNACHAPMLATPAPARGAKKGWAWSLSCPGGERPRVGEVGWSEGRIMAKGPPQPRAQRGVAPHSIASTSPHDVNFHEPAMHVFVVWLEGRQTLQRARRAVDETQLHANLGQAIQPRAGELVEAMALEHRPLGIGKLRQEIPAVDRKGALDLRRGPLRIALDTGQPRGQVRLELVGVDHHVLEVEAIAAAARRDERRLLAQAALGLELATQGMHVVANARPDRVVGAGPDALADLLDRRRARPRRTRPRSCRAWRSAIWARCPSVDPCARADRWEAPDADAHRSAQPPRPLCRGAPRRSTSRSGPRAWRCPRASPAGRRRGPGPARTGRLPRAPSRGGGSRTACSSSDRPPPGRAPGSD